MKIEKKISSDESPQQQKVSSSEEKTRRERSPHHSKNAEVTGSKRDKNLIKEIEAEEDQSLHNSGKETERSPSRSPSPKN